MKKVLIVEDSKVIANAVKYILEGDEITTMHTNDGAKVVDIVKKEKVDLVMLDLNMPKVTGEEVFLQLRSDPITKKVPVIILTAKADALKWNEKLRGCDKFIVKPFDNDKLFSDVKEVLDKCCQ